MILLGRRKKPPAGTIGQTRLAATADGDEAPHRRIDWTLIRRLLGLLSPWKGRFLLGISLSLGMVLLEMSSPLFIGAIVNVATAPEPRPTAAWGVVGIVGLWAVVWAAALLLQRAAILVITDAGEHVQFDLRRAVFAHLQHLSMNYYDKTKLGRIISRCTSDISSLREINVWGGEMICKNVLMIVVASIMLWITEPRLFVAVAWLGPLLYVCNRVYRRKASVAHQIAREGYTRVSANLAENITGVRVVTAFHRQGHNLSVFNDLQDANTRNNVQAARINGFYQSLLQLIGFIGRAVILLVGAYLASQNLILGGIGSVVAAFLYWEWLTNPILALGNFHNQLLSGLAGAERIFNLLDTQPEVQDQPNAKPLARIQGRVRFEGVTFGYDPQRPVLHNISFETAPGEMTALVGATGSGKSSMIALIARFYQPQKGRVLVDGADVREVTGDSLHHQMGLVLQTNYLFTGTVLDNIRYARPKAPESEVIEAAQQLGTHDAMLDLADGYATQVGERGSNLSLGQRQLICFTRAYLADPRVFLLDEATSAVDTATEHLVQSCLLRLLSGRTTFIVAHRLSTVQRADRILVLDQGRIIEQGTHSELRAAGGKYARLYEHFSRFS